jgi:hypothetical protein
LSHVFLKRGGALHPTDERGQAALFKISDGALVTCDIKRSRNLQHLRLYWSLIHRLYDNQERYASPETLSDAFKICAGLCETFVLPSGQVVHRPGSISFGKMKDDDFREFWERFVKVVCEKVLPNADSADLERDVFDMLDRAA